MNKSISIFSFGNLEFHSFYFFIIENFAFFLEKKILEAPCLSQPEPNPNSLKDELDMVVVKKKATPPKTQTIIKNRRGQHSENNFVGLFSNLAVL